MTRMPRQKQLIFLLIHPIFLLFASCSFLEDEITPFYEPVITFRGKTIKNFGKDSIYLPGNYYYPNSCIMVGDTMRMYFFSEDYTQGIPTWRGDQLRIDIYSHRPDTTPIPDSTGAIITGDVLIRLSRYWESNETYLINRGDTLYSPPMSVRMEAVSFGRSSDSDILINNIQAKLHQENRNSTVSFEFEDAVIEGKVE